MLEAKEGINNRLRVYSKIIARGRQDVRGQRLLDRTAMAAAQSAAIEAAEFYKSEVAPDWQRIQNMSRAEIEAANSTDANLGSLSGVLVMQATLPLFKYQFPVLGGMYQDFSAEPGLFNVAEISRIVVVPAVQEYDATSDATGRPKGWVTVQPVVSIDAPVTLDSYIGVPVVFGNTILAGTLRRLFEEFRPASMYALAKRFIGKVTALMTPANFNAYATVTAPDTDGIIKVPDAYPTYAVARKNFSVDSFQDVEAAFDANEVPPTDRGIVLNAKYFSQAKRDARLSLFFAAARDEEIITEGKLPAKVEGFVPFRGPYLPATNNMVGFAFHKAGIILKQRLPADFTKALPGVMIPGSVIPVTDSDSGLSCLLVEYVSLLGGFAEARMETMIGAAVGDKRGGLVITSA